MKNYTNEDLAYLAGFIDGDGSIFIAKHTQNGISNYEPRISISNGCKTTLEWIKNKFGGNINNNYKAGDFTSTKIKVNKDQYVWFSRVEELKNLLVGLIPYLKEKKSQAIVLLEYIKKKRKFHSRPQWYIQWQDDMYKKLKKMHHELEENNINEISININLNIEKNKQLNISDFGEE